MRDCRRQAVGVFVAVAVVDHAKRPRLSAGRTLAVKKLPHFAFRKIEAAKKLPPDLVQPFEPGAANSAAASKL